MPHDVSDARSNPNEQIEHAARGVGKSLQRRAIFQAVYTGKKRFKTVAEIATVTGLTRMRVLQEGKNLVNNHVVRQLRVDGDTAYEKDDFYHINKSIIMRLVLDGKKLEAYPTKRKLIPAKIASVQVSLNLNLAKTEIITIDDIESFSRVRDVAPSGELGDMSEHQFKTGVQRILKQAGEFKDWGGEKNDLYTTFLKFKGRRETAAFAFKGPGMRVAELTPAKLGKNGDQIQRLFQSQATFFFVQYWRRVSESVREQMHHMAIARSVLTGKPVFHGVIDGQDSLRLVKAYPKQFSLS